MTPRQKQRAALVKQLHRLEDLRLDGRATGRNVDALIEKYRAALVRHDREEQDHADTK